MSTVLLSPSEWKTSRSLIDPKLNARGWNLPKSDATSTSVPPGVSTLTEYPTADGQVMLQTAVAKDGSVAQVTAVTSLEGARNLRPCLEKIAKGWRFPPHNGEKPAPLTLPVRVKKGSRLGTIFWNDEGWYYQFDGTANEGPRCVSRRAATSASAASSSSGRVPAIGYGGSKTLDGAVWIFIGVGRF